MTSYSAISLFDSGTTSQCSTCNTTPVGRGRIDLQQPWPAHQRITAGTAGLPISQRPGPLAGFAQAAAAIKAHPAPVPKTERAAER